MSSDPIIESFIDSECCESLPKAKKLPSNCDSQFDIYRQQQVATQVVAVGIGQRFFIPTNPYRVSILIYNQGTLNIGVAIPSSESDPTTLVSPFPKIADLLPNTIATLDCKCLRRIIQGNIILLGEVNTGTSSNVTIVEVLATPDSEPYNIGGRYGTL